MRIGKAASLAVCLLCISAIQGCTGLALVVASQDRRTPGTYIDDELVELRMQIAVSEDEMLSSQTHVNATSFNGIVLLTGEAPGESLRARIVEIARRMPHVRSVRNEIALEAPSALLARANDSIVTGRVKAALLRDARLHPAQVRVVTERGNVYLMGLLTRDEADRATNIARRVPGARYVVRLVEYIR